jgi:hypothetical protein
MKSRARRRLYHVSGVCAGILLVLSAATLAFSSGSAAGRTTSASIVGAAWKSDNKPIPNAKLRLRNVVNGKIEATTVGSEGGRFGFLNIESGSYIVELISDDGKIIAVSQTVTVGPGETVATFVRLGTKVPWFTGFFGNAAASIASVAASLGVTAMAPEEMQCASPPCSN